MNIIIIGLGLIGGSIAKELSSSQDFNILAYDLNQESIKTALTNKTIHGAINNLDELYSDEHKDSLIIIATPPKASVEILKSLSFLFNSNVTITDTSSTKLLLDKTLRDYDCPNNVILSHPVAGSHLSGEKNSVDGLFQEKKVIVSHHDSVGREHLEKVRSLWTQLGAESFNLDSVTHDYIFANTSHLPHLASYALLMTLKDINEENISKFSGRGLGEFLRLSSSSPEMWADIFSLNNQNIVSSLEQLIKNLNQLKSTINDTPEDMQSLLIDLKKFKEENY